MPLFVSLRRMRLLAAAACALLHLLSANAAVAPLVDSTEKPFRIAPMREAARTVVLNLNGGWRVGYDMDRFRVHTMWRGDLALFGPPYSGSKKPFLAEAEGDILSSSPPFFPWLDSAGQLQRAPGEGTDLDSLDIESGSRVARYQMKLEEQSVRVEERFAVAPTGNGWPWRSISANGPMGKTRYLCHAAQGEWVETGRDELAAIQVAPGRLLCALLTDGAASRWAPDTTNERYWVEDVTEEGTEKGWERRSVNPGEARLFVESDAAAAGLSFSFVTFEAANVEEAKAIAEEIAASLGKLEGGPIPKPERYRSESAGQTIPRGDESYRIEHFPVPKEIDLLVGGMDWAPNGDLVVCTWPGDIFIVEGAQGDVSEAVYRRFATGLNEPLGLAVVGDDIYVTQKTGLTRVRDQDGDGAADLFENINDDWGYSGNYHSYAFGPAVSEAGDFFVFLTSQRGRWDLPYLGWAARIDGETHELSGFSHGLRVPNGFGFVGPERDLFASDNQGNWIGACKLNHLKPGAYYGFPSSWPAAKEDYGTKQQFTPPAVWFPRELAPSVSDFVEIKDDRFGPFKGQLMVGDFQNAVVMRVSMEKVGGEWQGAVWPFAKSFQSGVNRLSYGPDGKVYVGGCKRTWAAAAPREYSLDRISFTGQAPFEIQNVSATARGFRLVFTQPVDIQEAADPQNYLVRQFAYEHHQAYGSPEFDQQGKENSRTEIPIEKIFVKENGLEAEMILPALRAGYVTEISAASLLSAEGDFPRNDTLFYTLNKIPKE